MPLTEKGKEIRRKFREQYGREQGNRRFYASQNKGRIKGTHKKGGRKR